MNVADWVGRSIGDGRYKIQSLLGEGNMGRVYRAYDLRLETDVCIKVPRSTRIDAPEFRQRFQHEIRSLVRLSHPHIVKILDVGEQQGAPYCVMQYLAGGSLRDRQPPNPGGFYRPMPLASLHAWLLPMAKALDFVHAQNYVHRDVKPANILFDQSGNAFISDYGLAKVLAADSDTNQEADLTQAGHVVGTPYYIAPEVVMGTACDGRADQYSLAVTVHEVLCGRPLFDGNTSSAIVVHQIKTAPKPLAALVPGIPASLSAAVLRALAKHPRQRFGSCCEFVEAVLADVPTRSTVKRTPPPPNPNVSHGGRGQIPCPKCKKVLLVRPEFGGKRARCGHCSSQSIISSDATMLTLVMQRPAAQAAVTGGNAASDASPQRAGGHGTGVPPVHRSRLDQVFEEMDFAAAASPASPSRSVGGETMRTPMPDTMTDELVLEEKVFGYRVSKQAFAVISAVVLALALATAGLVGHVVSRDDADQPTSAPSVIGRDDDDDPPGY